MYHNVIRGVNLTQKVGALSFPFLLSLPPFPSLLLLYPPSLPFPVPLSSPFMSSASLPSLLLLIPSPNAVTGSGGVL